MLSTIEVTYAPEDPDVRNVLHYKALSSNSQENLTDFERRLNSDFFGLQLPGPAKVIQIMAGPEASIKIRAVVSWDVKTQFTAFQDTDRRLLDELGIKSISLVNPQSLIVDSLIVDGDDLISNTQIITLRDYYQGAKYFPSPASASPARLSASFPPHVEELASSNPPSFPEPDRYLTPPQFSSTSSVSSSPCDRSASVVWPGELESRLRAEFEVVLKARLAEVQREYEAKEKEAGITIEGYMERMAELQKEHNKETQRLRERLMHSESCANENKKEPRRARTKPNTENITIPREIAEMPLHGINGLQVRLFAARIELELKKRKLIELEKKAPRCESCMVKEQLLNLLKLDNRMLEMRMEMSRNELQWAMDKILRWETQDLPDNPGKYAYAAGDEEETMLYQEDAEDSGEETIIITQSDPENLKAVII